MDPLASPPPTLTTDQLKELEAKLNGFLVRDVVKGDGIIDVNARTYSTDVFLWVDSLPLPEQVAILALLRARIAQSAWGEWGG